MCSSAPHRDLLCTRVMMAIRTLITAEVAWTVWDVHPSSPERLRPSVAEAMQVGWLVFECQTEKRRVVPIPAGWESWPDGELANLLHVAIVVPRKEVLSNHAGL